MPSCCWPPSGPRRRGFQEGNYDLAERYFIDLIGTGLYVPDALFYLGNIAEIDGDLDSAVSFYSQVTSGGNLIPARVRLSLILYRLGKTEEALRSLENVVAADPESSIDLAAARGELLMRVGRFDEALELYNHELERYPGDRGLLFSRSFLYERMDKVDDAVAELRALLAQDPDDPVALNALGYTLADRTDQHEEAYELIRRAYELSPDNAAIVDSMGWVEYRMGRPSNTCDAPGLCSGIPRLRRISARCCGRRVICRRPKRSGSRPSPRTPRAKCCRRSSSG